MYIRHFWSKSPFKLPPPAANIPRIYLILVDTEAATPLNSDLGNYIQIFPPRVGIAKVIVKVNHLEHLPVDVPRSVGRIVGNMVCRTLADRLLRQPQPKF